MRGWLATGILALMSGRAIGGEGASEPFCHGTVVDRAGAPVVGAQVTAYASDSLPMVSNAGLAILAAEPKPSSIATSDRSGAFRLVVQEAGYYVLRIEARGHGTVFIPVAASRAGVPRVRAALPAGSRRGGVVVDAGGAPVVGAVVVALLGDESSAWRRYTAKTDAKGAWTVEGVSVPELANRLPEFVIVRVAASPHATWGAIFDPSTADAASRTVVVGGSTSVAIRLRGPGGKGVRGKLVLSASRDDLQPHPFAELAATNGVEVVLETKDDGTVVVEGLPAGAIIGVFATSDGHLRGSLERPVDLPEKTRTEIVVDMTPTTEVAGWVRLEDGAGVRQALVWLEPSPPLAEDARTTTDVEGRFRLRRPEGWPSSLAASAAGFVSKSGPHILGESATEDVVVEMVRPAVVSGVVIDAKGKPAAGSLVIAGVVLLSAGVEATTGEDGSFLLPSVMPGSVLVAAKHAGRVSGGHIDLRAGERRDGVVIQLTDDEPRPEDPVAPEPVRPEEPPPERER